MGIFHATGAFRHVVKAVSLEKIGRRGRNAHAGLVGKPPGLVARARAWFCFEVFILCCGLGPLYGQYVPFHGGEGV
jgi:hypothetical protein